MMSTILSGEKMVLAHSKTNCELPPVGVKEFKPNHSWLEQKQIQSALDHRKTLLEAERVEKESNLMMADWKPENHKAAVSRKGKHWETFGHHSDNEDWLFPEEVLFLMEMNCLECSYGEVPLSIQKGYAVLLRPENGCSLNEYRVFAHLCRAGYRVLRHLPNLTVTAYERTIRLDQHLKERKTYSDTVVVEESVPEETVDVPRVSEKHEECLGKTRVSEVVIGNSQLSKQLEKAITDKAQVLDKPVEVASGKTEVSKKTVTNCVGELTKRKLRKIQRKNARLREKLITLQGGHGLKKLHVSQVVQRRRLNEIVKKYKPYQTNNDISGHQHEVKRHADVEHDKFKKISFLPNTEDETPEVPSERWQPPVIISDLPENIEMSIGSMPVQAEEAGKEKVTIEIIDIADTSEEEEDVESDNVDSDSDIEIIQEIRPPVHDDEEEEEDEDDLEIIEVPIPKKEIIVETLSSDSEEEEEEDGSGSERSYDGNWKRNRPKKKNKFVRPPTMSHLTFAAVDEFCAGNKLQKEIINGEDSSNRNGNDSGEFISLETSNSRAKRPVFQIEKTRNEILDLMPTMAGQNRKLMTLDSPDLRLIPDNIIPKQQAYTYSTNALRARVFRQGFRGRRNFHGPRFTSFNPYYNNTNGNFFPNQLSIGGPQALFQTPQLSQLVGGGDITSVARGVMQIASALLMNLPQNNMNNGLLPYNPRPPFPMANPNFAQIESPNLPSSHFSHVNQNFSYNEQSNMNRHSFSMPQRSNSRLQHLFDMPQQRNFGTPNHLRFSENSNSPAVENTQHNQNFSVDLSRSSESDFDSSDRNFTSPIGSNHSGGNFRNNRAENFRSNRAANFRSKRGRFRGKHQSHRGGLSQRNSLEGSHSHFIDPAYIKPDVPVPGEPNSISHGISDFIPISPSTSNQETVEIISIEDNDDGFVPKRGISNRFVRKKLKKRKLMRLKGMAKKKCRKQSSESNTNPEIIFLDSPSLSKTYADESTLDSVKQEKNTDIRVKTETESEHRSVKQEEMEPVGMSVKQESVEEPRMKVESEEQSRIKTEKAGGENNGIRVKVEQGGSGQNVRVEIKIESSSDTSSVVSLPLANLVKEEPCQVKSESVEGLEPKTEAMDVVESVKTENLDEHENKEGILDTTKKNSEAPSDGVEISERTQSESMDTSVCETERTKQNENENTLLVQTDSDVQVEVDGGNDVGGESSNNEVLCSRTDLSSEDSTTKKVSSWAEIKKTNLPLSAFLDTESQDETENEIDDQDEIRPLLRPKHCKTIGTVLSALQIFTPFTSTPPEDVTRLKISFDMYLPTEFRKSHRGLPQYRIVVFGGTEPLPSPAQLREVNTRFQDSVPVLTAVVNPGSVVFYTFTDVDLPQDSTSYTK